MFENIAAHKRKGNEVFKLPLHTPIGVINLTGRIAGEANPLYYNEVLKTAGTTAKQAKRTGTITASQIQEARDRDIELFPKFVLTGWSYIDEQGSEQIGPPDSNGTFVAFTPEACSGLLKALDNEVVDFVRQEFASTVNFSNATSMDAEALGKN